MREFDGDPNNAYILVRVFNMGDERSAGVTFFREPWSLYMDNILYFNSENGYAVGEAS